MNDSSPSAEHLQAIFARFVPEAREAVFERLHGGHINLTYAVTAPGAGRYILQAVNRNVFRDAENLMENVLRVSEHLGRKYAALPDADRARNYLHFLRTADGASGCGDAFGYWRVYHYIDGVETRLTATTTAEAHAAAAAFGRFQAMLSDMPGPRLAETIPQFHDTRNRFAKLEAAVAADPLHRAAGAADTLAGLRDLRESALELQCVFEAGKIPERIVHNDAKYSNILLDSRDNHAVCIIDLDTCMPGLSLHDFGDLVRSMVCPAPEDEPDTSRVRVNPAMYAALCEGFLSTASGMLNPVERKLLRAGAVSMTSEVAVRFFTDYLEGDHYFHTAYPGHNLVRAKSQLALARSILDELPAE